MSSRIQAILVAVDGSESANRALDVAAALARVEGARLTIATVAMPAPADVKREFQRVEGETSDPAEAAGQLLLAEAVQRAGWADVKAKSVLLWGDPAQTLINAIVSEKVDAMVIGRRGRGQLAGLLLGSVSQKLVSLSPCMVIVVP